MHDCYIFPIKRLTQTPGSCPDVSIKAVFRRTCSANALSQSIAQYPCFVAGGVCVMRCVKYASRDTRTPQPHSNCIDVHVPPQEHAHLLACQIAIKTTRVSLVQTPLHAMMWHRVGKPITQRFFTLILYRSQTVETSHSQIADSRDSTLKDRRQPRLHTQRSQTTATPHSQDAPSARVQGSQEASSMISYAKTKSGGHHHCHSL